MASVSVQLKITGMLCMENCGVKLEKALEANHEIIADAKVDFDSRTAYVTLQPGQSATKEVLRSLTDTVEVVGYEVNQIVGEDGDGGGMMVKQGSSERASIIHRGGVATEVGLELLPTKSLSNHLLSTTKRSRNRARNALRSTPGVICALVHEEASTGKLIARVRVRTLGAERSLVEAVTRAAFQASFIAPKEAQMRLAESIGGRRGDDDGENDTAPTIPSSQSVVGHMGDSTAIFDVKGMTCGACVATLENGLKKADGVVQAKVALLSEKAQVLYDSHATNSDKLKDLIEILGYGATLLKHVREDGEKSLGTAAFEVTQPDIGSAVGRGGPSPLSFTGLYEGLTGTEGVVNVEMRSPRTALSAKATATKVVWVLVRYEPELVGLRDLVKAMRAQGYGARLLPEGEMGEEGQSSAMSLSTKQDAHLKTSWHRLLFALLLSIPVVLLVMAPPETPFLDDPPLTPGLRIRDLMLLFLSGPVQFGAGAVFYKEAFKGLRGGSYGMALLVAMGTTAAWAFAVFSLIRAWASGGKVDPNSDFFMTSCMLLFFILLGKYLEHAAKKRTSTALTKLMDFAPKMALLTSGEKAEEEMIPIELVQTGDILKVVRGTKVPADGVVVSGQGWVDEALITGEPLPATKRIGDRVVGGSLNTEGLFTMRVTRIGEDSALSQIIRLMEDAQMAKAPIQALADRIAGSFALIVLALSFLTFAGWLVFLKIGIVPPSWIPAKQSSPLVLAITLGISTMVVACPCAMGLATPTAIMVGTGVGAANGVLIKGGEALETAYRLSAVVFDKTGTLTMGQPAVALFEALDSFDWARTLWLVASAERGSEHPLAKCIVRYANSSQGPGLLVEPEDFKAVSGKGLVCKVQGKQVTVGSLAWLEECGVESPSSVAQDAAKAAEAMGKIVVWAGVGGKAASRMEILDAPRPEAQALIQALTHKLKLQVYMVTGDNRRTAKTIAESLGILPDNVMAETLPSNKVAKIKELQSRGHIVAMVGDGINDAPALAQADVGIAIGTGTDIAIEAADMVLIKSDLSGVLTAIHLSRKIVSRIYLNLVWALAYNVIGIPLAAGLLMPILHTAVPPFVAGAAMALSSVSVLASSLTLKWYTKPQVAGLVPPTSASNENEEISSYLVV